MDPIQYAINSTIYKIPLKILQEAFRTFYKLRNLDPPYNFIVANEIYKNVIQANVLPDCNVAGGKMKECLLKEEMRIPTDDFDKDLSLVGFRNVIYRIPEVEREGRDITRVVGVHHKTLYNNYSDYVLNYNSSSMVNTAREVLGAQTSSDRWSPPSAELIGIDLVRLISAMVNHTNLILEFEIAYPPTLHNITGSSLPFFADMIMYATQVFVYNNLVIDIDQAAARGGITIGAIRDIIYEYKDAEDKYQEALTKFTGTESFDVKKQIRLMQFMV